MNRRHFIALTASSAALSLLPHSFSLANTPEAQALKILADGHVIAPTNLLQISELQTAKIKRAGFDTNIKLEIPVGVFLLQTDNGYTLFDTGGGALADTMGQLPESLKKISVTPEQIRRIILTHMHFDHIGGLLDKDGNALFPKAELFICDKEYAFWLDNKSPSIPNGLKPNFELAAKCLQTYGKRIKQFTGEADLGDGIQAVPLYGHTPGHTGFMVKTAKETIFIAGDILHAPAYQVPHPEWSSIFDISAILAAKSRQRALKIAADQKLTLAAMHLSKTGFAKVELDGKSFVLKPHN